MRWFIRIQVLLRSFRFAQADRDIDEELQDHLRQEIESHVHAGMSLEEARYAAQRTIGPLALFREQCQDSRGSSFLESSLRDLRYAVQMLRRTPLFTCIAVLTLALAIGANTFIFTFVENVILRSLPVSHPEQLVSLNWGRMVNMSYPNYLSFRDQNTVFSQLVASRVSITNLSIRPRENFLAWGYEASGNYFRTLGIQPELGRFFTEADDDIPGAHPVLVISHRYWRSHFAASPRVLGQVIKLNGYPFTIIGVTPSSFTGTELVLTCDFWAPMSMELEIEPGNDWYHSRNAQNIWTMGRLKPGVSPRQAEANLNQVAFEIVRAFPDAADPKARFHLARPGLIGDNLRQPITSFSVVLAILAGLVLLMACINLAGMLLARAADRHREIGIRLALGASRLRLLRQLMMESLLLATLGGVAGFALAATTCYLFTSWHPDLGIPVDSTLRPDGLVLCFTLVVALAATLFFGLVPALQSTRIAILPSLKNEPVSERIRRFSLRDLLVAGQVALSVVMLICSALVIRGLQHALSLNLGYNPAHAVSVSFDLRSKNFSSEGSRRFASALLRKVSGIPGLDAVGITSNMPLRLDHGNNSVISRVDLPPPKASDAIGAVVYNISPNFLPLLEPPCSRDVSSMIVTARVHPRFSSSTAPLPTSSFPAKIP